MRMTVIGCGYLGVTHAACMASLGHEVLGVDTDVSRVNALQRGELPFYEPGLGHLLCAGLDSGRLQFTTDYAQALDFASLHFLTMGTPELGVGQGIDISAVVASVEKLAVPGQTIVGKSTVPVGTAAALQRAHPEAEIAWNPEFLREGSGVTDTLRPDRIVVGCAPDSSVPKLLRAVYAATLASGTPLIITDLATAELAKTSANAFLATKISFINAIAQLCDATGANVQTLAEIMGLDPRIGADYLGAGLGFGGGCLPKDLRGLVATAVEHDASGAAHILRTVDEINNSQRQLLGAKIAELASPGAKVAMLGAAFKPHSDDTRDSPALELTKYLQTRGFAVALCDPQVLPEAGILDTLIDAHLVVLATEWPEFVGLDPVAVKQVVRKAVMVDCRNALDRNQWQQAGWDYHGVGI